MSEEINVYMNRIVKQIVHNPVMGIANLFDEIVKEMNRELLGERSIALMECANMLHDHPAMQYYFKLRSIAETLKDVNSVEFSDELRRLAESEAKSNQ